MYWVNNNPRKFNNIMLYSYWRTGSNLLARIIQHYGSYFDINEWYSYMYDMWQFNNGWSIPVVPRKEINEYLVNLTIESERKTIVKCILHQVDLVNDQTLYEYRNTILLHRYNLDKVIISKYIADYRKSYFRRVGHEQPLFDQDVDLDHFAQYIEIVLQTYEKFIDEHHDFRTNWVFTYEDDVLPIAKNIELDWFPTNNYTIRNLKYLEDMLSAEPVTQRMKSINQWFDAKIKSRSGSLADMLKIIKDIKDAGK